ncbi:cysteine protease ATG4D [Neodiprion pinetum]|uniref:Cysteine protease n=1 Tax=Neodiprion lecontei TaxID=441921 RepID=A0A6J0BAJ0_NEOLC|nr:cysteine protease ATG4D [Neodiprion lecontei]XP_046485288.1 cysteine protease ATG4D [Neodiprion pinetum]
MNGQLQSSRERLGAFSGGAGWFTGFVTPGHTVSSQKISQISVDDSSNGAEVDGKMKKKLMSMWNNVKYGWSIKIKTNFSKESPVFLLGSCYHKRQNEDSPERAVEAVGLDMGTGSNVSLAKDACTLEQGMDGFRKDFTSRLWLTYRREFPILNGSNFTTDCGWGCMLRSGQMMLAQALVCHFLGREWRWRPDGSIDSVQQFHEDSQHRMIIKWFGDQPAPLSPLSIHALVSLGTAAGKKAGDWYGPSSVAHLLKQAVERAAICHVEFDQLAVYVAQDCAVYMDDVAKVCQKPDGSWRSLVLLVPLRLGMDKLNPGYAPCLTALLSLEDCIGVIGGRPRHSLYFIGYQEDKLIHLDPHYCQETVDVWRRNFSLESFHCTSPRKMLLSKMDPSCCVGFYFRDKAAFDSFVTVVTPFLIPPNQKVEYPMFLFSEGSGADVQRSMENRKSVLSSSEESTKIEDDDSHYECEEFELCEW